MQHNNSVAKYYNVNHVRHKLGRQQKLEAVRTKFLVAKNEKQKQYIRLIKEKTIIFAIGEAGTGKSYVSTSLALQELKAEKIEKIIITRPIVQVDEDLGFLPGDLHEKINPYVLPIYNILKDYIDQKELTLLIEEKRIEIIPLAFMRGHTFSNCYVLCDEMENATYNQLKTLLTRLGPQGKLIINGDVTQSDLPYYQRGALQDIIDSLEELEEVGIVEFERADIVRHTLIGKILDKLEVLEKEDRKVPKGYIS